MIYYLAKAIEATGLVVILIGFVMHFPKLMDHKTLMVGILIFLIGWISEQYLLKR